MAGKTMDKIPELSQLLIESLAKGDVPEQLKFLSSGLSSISCVPVGEDDGIVNYIYRVTDPNTNNTFIIKWSTETPKLTDNTQVPPEWKDQNVLIERNAREADALSFIGSLVPGSSPTVLWCDLERHYFIMDDLSAYSTFKSHLERGDIKMWMFEKIGDFMGELHHNSHKKNMKADKFEAMVKKHTHPTLMSSLELFMSELVFGRESIFGSALRRHTPALSRVLPRVIEDPEVMGKGRSLAHYFNQHPQAFIHNDLHPGSFMIGQGEVKVIDPEWCTVGPPAKEFGHFLGEILIYYYVHEGRGRREVCEEIKKAMTEFASSYMKHMGEYIDDKEEFMKHAAGFAGHQAAVRTINLPLPDFRDYEDSEADCVEAALRLLHGMDRVTDIDRFLFIALALC